LEHPCKEGEAWSRHDPVQWGGDFLGGREEIGEGGEEACGSGRGAEGQRGRGAEGRGAEGREAEGRGQRAEGKEG